MKGGASQPSCCGLLVWTTSAASLLAPPHTASDSFSVWKRFLRQKCDEGSSCAHCSIARHTGV
eukprot:4475728-Prymnesium_polylepis.1